MAFIELNKIYIKKGCFELKIKGRKYCSFCLAFSVVDHQRGFLSSSQTLIRQNTIVTILSSDYI